MRRTLSLITVLALVLSLVLAAPPMSVAHVYEDSKGFPAEGELWSGLIVRYREKDWDNPYTDVAESDWFYSVVRFVTENGLMSGLSADKFSPNITLTRGMVAMALYCMEGCPDATDLANPYDDVAEEAWYTDAVKWVTANGVLAGFGDGNFGPEYDVNREALMVILVNYIRSVGIELEETQDSPEFLDESDISEWAKKAVALCYRAKIISGSSDNRFLPQHLITRAEFAAVIHNFVMVTERQDIPGKILNINYTGFTQLVSGCAANIPVTVTSENDDGLTINAGLFVDEHLIISVPVVEGKALIKAPVLNGKEAYIAAWFGDDMSTKLTKAVPLKHLSDNIWTPELVSLSGVETAILFGDRPSLTANSMVKIDGVHAKSFWVESNILYIEAEVAPGQKIEMKGVKYPDLFPSYSFTFTVEAK